MAERVHCCDCLFWESTGDAPTTSGKTISMGKCHRHPPTVIPNTVGGPARAQQVPALTQWPCTKSDAFCGDGIAK